MYSLISTAPGWARVQWRFTAKVSSEVQKLLIELAPVPGVRVQNASVELPYTTWMLPAAKQLFEATSTRAPVRMNGFGLQATALMPAGLYDHQDAGIRFLLGGQRVLLADPMGYGKSRQAAVAAHIASCAHQSRPVIIVAPLFTREVWRRELLAIGAIAKPEELCCLASRNLDDPSFNPAARFFFVHYDIARYWWSLFQRVRPIACIVDEAHWVKHGRAARAVGANMIAGRCDYRFLLTGTPLENEPADLWNLLTITTGAHSWGTFTAFRQRYCGATYNGFGYEDGEPSNMLELHARLQPFYLRRESSVLKGLPALQRQLHVADVNESFQLESRRILGGQAKQLVQAISTGSVEAVLPLLTRLRQVTSRAKLSATVEYVQNALEQGEHVVVFVWERVTAHALAGRLPGTLLVTGEQSIDERSKRVDTFQTSTEPRALVATMGALKEGVTLHRARIVVLHDLDWVLTHLLQAEARVHRIGQLRACQAVWMLAQGTSDMLLAPVLAAKAAAMEQVLGLKEGTEATRSLEEAAGVKSVERQIDDSLAAWEAQYGAT